jgi:excisionase family DNA binding protein
MTPQEVAETYDVTPDAVYQAVKRDTIPYRKLGSTILIRRWDAEKRWREKSNRGRPRQTP